MGIFEFIGIIVFLYYLINIVLWIILDSDIELWIKERWGKPIGKNIFTADSRIQFKKKEKMNCHRFPIIITRLIEREIGLDYGRFKRNWKTVGNRIS